MFTLTLQHATVVDAASIIVKINEIVNILANYFSIHYCAT